MSIEKKLGVWGRDEIINSEGKFSASDYYCVKCYDSKEYVQAEKFWPAFDPDIESFPYCRPCLDELKLKLMIDLF